MTDRELLEAAAKAAGYDVRWHEIFGCFVHVGPFNITNPPTMAGQRLVWVPLDDDGDALRLRLGRRQTSELRLRALQPASDARPHHLRAMLADVHGRRCADTEGDG